MELEGKGEGVSSHCYILKLILLHTVHILNCNVIYTLVREIKFPNMLWRYVVSHLICLSAEGPTDPFPFVSGLLTALLICHKV
jgi:hypothetical protein